ncbi:hypothetical protein AGDE_12964 [Angomonas deanei]|nr:hypothetical protein AGDE_12964 [Angomonas deanei]|eukprot:EPY23262.1 hypothetical protein AGDE_12964 [Angomonas deanei]
MTQNHAWLGFVRLGFWGDPWPARPKTLASSGVGSVEQLFQKPRLYFTRRRGWTEGRKQKTPRNRKTEGYPHPDGKPTKTKRDVQNRKGQRQTGRNDAQLLENLHRQLPTAVGRISKERLPRPSGGRLSSLEREKQARERVKCDGPAPGGNKGRGGGVEGSTTTALTAKHHAGARKGETHRVKNGAPTPPLFSATRRKAITGPRGRRAEDSPARLRTRGSRKKAPRKENTAGPVGNEIADGS